MNNQIIRYKVHWLSVYWIYMDLKYLKIIGMIYLDLFEIKFPFLVSNNYVLIIVMKNYNNYLLNSFLNKNKKNMNEKI